MNEPIKIDISSITIMQLATLIVRFCVACVVASPMLLGLALLGALGVMFLGQVVGG